MEQIYGLTKKTGKPQKTLQEQGHAKQKPQQIIQLKLTT